jgi:hypothetical protein
LGPAAARLVEPELPPNSFKPAGSVPDVAKLRLPVVNPYAVCRDVLEGAGPGEPLDPLAYAAGPFSVLG